MSLPAIGSLTQVGLAGRPGVVLGTQRVGQAHDGQQLIAVTVKQAGGGCSDCDSGGSGGCGDEAGAGLRDYQDLSAPEKAEVDRLRQRDQQVRQEETAHAGAAGDLGGPIAYVYQRGPDGRQYAVGGSVPIQSRLSSGDPQADRQIGARMTAAAHAATNPSGPDLSVAGQGYGLQARAERQQGERGATLDLSA